LFIVEALHSFGKGFICTPEYLRDKCAYGLNLRAAPLRAAADDQSGSHGDEEESEDPGSFKVSKSRYESFYEGQGDGGKLGAIDTTAVDDARCVCACVCVGGVHAVEGYLYPICALVVLIGTPISGT
jgi:hypothetical protein